MTTRAMVETYIQQICLEIGTTADAIYSKQTDSWHFTKGSAKLQVCFVSYTTVTQTIRTFIRVFAPVYPIPTSPEKKLNVYSECMAGNRMFMGMKFATFPEDGQLYVFGERPIDGMDYTEFSTLVGDTASWADQMDDLLVQKFGTATTGSN